VGGRFGRPPGPRKADADGATSREEIFGLMRVELGLENPDAILDRLIL
jgi:hypothetical protein